MKTTGVRAEAPQHLKRHKKTMIDPLEFMYSEVYSDNTYEYRHVIPPERYRDYLQIGKLLSEEEWRTLGIQMSPGWQHYMVHDPEPHIFLFRRPKRDNTCALSNHDHHVEADINTEAEV